MDPVVGGWDLVGIILACIGIGAVGGLAYDLTEPLTRRPRRPGSSDSTSGESFGDNRVLMPRVRNVAGRRTLDAGFLGPMAVGAAAAIATVFALAVVRPDAPPRFDRQAVLRELESRDVETSIVVAVERVLIRGRDPYVPWDRLILLGLVAGFGGAAVVRGLRARLITAVGGVALDARIAGIREGGDVTRDAVAREASDETDPTVNRSVKAVLEPAIESAIEARVETVAASSPFGGAAV